MLGLLLSYYILYSGNDANDPFLWSDALKSPQIGSHTSKIGFRFPSWHSKIQRLFDLLVWKDTHFHVKFDLETPNCLPIIANNPDNCNDFPVIFKVICQNWEFTNFFLPMQKIKVWQKDDDESSKIGRWLLFFSALIFNQLHFRVSLAHSSHTAHASKMVFRV